MPTGGDLTVLGINRSQDASICLLRDNKIVAAIAKERLSRRKHDWGKLGDFQDYYVGHVPELIEQPIAAVVECFSTKEPTARELRLFHDELRRTLPLVENVRFFRISHHFAHLYSAYDPSGFSEAAAMIIDAQGSLLLNLTESWPQFGGDSRLREIMSFYRCCSTERTCIGKQTWDGLRANAAGLGMFYYLLTQTMWSGEGHEGKLMGLASYGNPEQANMPKLNVKEYDVHFPDPWADALIRAPKRFDPSTGPESFSQAADFAAAGQKAFEDALAQVACWLHQATGLDSLCFAGGTALNCAANTRLLLDTPFKRLFIPTAPGDAGTAVGCALYGMEQLTGMRPVITWPTDYLGPAHSNGPIPPGWAIEHPTNLWQRVVEILKAGKVIGLIRGRSEFGPRALGHRSILADPRPPEMRARINKSIKGRAWFRPLSPLVPLDEAQTYFDIDRPSPFMQWTGRVRPEFEKIMPAIVHCDGTARIQTLTLDQDHELYQLLKLFGAEVGVSVVVNTSFNGKDKPIVESLADALECLRTTELDCVVAPPMIISKSVP